MLSPYTPPRTKVVCIDASATTKYVTFRRTRGGLDGLADNAIYTVQAIIPCEFASSGYHVILSEINRPRWHGLIIGFALERFRRVTDIEQFRQHLHVAPSPKQLERA